MRPGLTGSSRDSARQLVSRVDAAGGLEASRLFPGGSRLTRSQDGKIIEPDSPSGQRARPGLTSGRGGLPPASPGAGPVPSRRSEPPPRLEQPRRRKARLSQQVRPGRSAQSPAGVRPESYPTAVADPASTGGRCCAPAAAPSNSRCSSKHRRHRWVTLGALGDWNHKGIPVLLYG